MTAVQILYDGDDITADVEIQSARFTAQANAQIGQCLIRVKDTGHTYVPGYFQVGKTLELYLDGSREWDGWVFIVGRKYAFDVDNTENPVATPRYWVLTGFDRNVLLHRRYLYLVSNPHNVSPFKEWPAGTADQTALEYALANYVDLTGDGLDMSSGIESIASPDPFEPFILSEPMQDWSTLFDDAIKMTGGVYYIDPDRVIRYVDDTTPTAPYALTDKIGSPAGAHPYRELEILSSAEAMANDAFVWGAGLGSSTSANSQLAFARVEDADSIALHGRWQWKDSFEGFFLDSSCEKRAQTYVYGSPSHHRGHKDDQFFVKCSLFEPGIRVSHVVDFYSQTYEYHDPIPVRILTITFPTPSSVRYDLMLSHDFDAAFAGFDLPHGGGGPPPPGDVITETFGGTQYTSPASGWEELTAVVNKGYDRGSDPYGPPINYVANGGIPADPPPDPYARKAVYFNVAYTTIGMRCTLDGDPLGPGAWVGTRLNYPCHLLGHPPTTIFDGVEDIPVSIPPTAPVLFRATVKWDAGHSTLSGGAGLFEVGMIQKPAGVPIDANDEPVVFRAPGLFDINHQLMTATDVTFNVTDAFGGYRRNPFTLAQFPVGDSAIVAVYPYIQIGSTTFELNSALLAMTDPAIDTYITLKPIWPVSEEFLCDQYYYGEGGFGTSPELNGQAGSGKALLELEVAWFFGTTTGPVIWIGGGDYQTGHPYVAGTLEVSVNGEVLVKGTDFNETDPSTGKFSVSLTLDLSGGFTVTYTPLGTNTVPDPNPTPVDGFSGGRVYRPHAQSQLGWGTIYDGYNCGMATAAMAMDRHTLGAFSDTVGTPRSTPPNMRLYSGKLPYPPTVATAATGPEDMQTAWQNGWQEYLDYVGFVSYERFCAYINEGRGAGIAGTYGALPSDLRFSGTFTGAHEVYVNEQFSDESFLVYDPIIRRANRWSAAVLKAYAFDYSLTNWGINSAIRTVITRRTPVT